MNMLSLFPLIPLLMMLGLWISKSTRQIRAVMVAGSSLLLVLAVVLVFRFLGLREAGETAAMLLTDSHVWYAPLNIHYAVGVDGISVAMLLLSAVIVFTGTFASWRMDRDVKEYFLWFCLLSVGVFGFFVSVDLFTMFLFYEVALIPMYLLPEAAHELSWIFIVLTTISVVYGALSACVQTDLKYINAYSSVSHCGLVLFAILMMNETAATGAVLQMLSHGLMTALFFALIGMIYGRTHTRDIRQLGGLMKIMPFLAVGYVIAGLANLGLPGLSGFVAEMTIFNGAFMHADTFHRVATIVACTSIVITAVYILRVVGRILYGTCDNPEHLALTDATWDERFAVVCLIVAVAGMGLAPLWVSDLVRGGVGTVITHLMN